MLKISHSEIIRNCYLRILKREPDNEGIAHFLNLMQNGEIDEKKLVDILRNSDEYKRVKLAEPFDDKKPYVFKGFYDICYLIRPSSVLDDIVVKNGIYDKWISSKLSELIHDNATIFDIGANVGLTSMPFAVHYVPKGIVCAFEPDKEVANQLRENIGINKIKNVVIEQLALQNDPLKKEIVLNKRRAIHDNGLRNDGLSTIEENPTYNIGQETVRASTIDIYVKSNHITNLELIKIDAEGAESKILQGGSLTIDTFSPIIIYEYSRLIDNAINYANTEKSFEFIKNKGYKQYQILNEENLSLIGEYNPELSDSNVVCFPESKLPVQFIHSLQEEK